MESVRDYPQTAVQSCHSAGKSFISAVIAAWWIDSHPAGEAFVVTSAPTGHQVKAILWREINRMHKRGGLKGRTNLTEWYDDAGELVAFGRKPNDYEPTAFQGIHARYVLVILDEACGIPKVLWEAASSLASNENGRILAIGNPDDPTSEFASVCERSTWHRIRISAFDTPNFTSEVVPDIVREMLVSRRWVDEKKEEWGELSPTYTSKVLGMFPTDAEDGVVPHSWAVKCRYTELQPDGEVELGFDVSGGGNDRSVCWARRGSKVLRKWVWKGISDPLELATLVLEEAITPSGATSIKIDSIGVGWGVGGIIDGWHRDGRHDCVVVPVNVGTAAYDSEHFLNLRAEVWWNLRELCRQELVDLAELDDDDMTELTLPKYHTRNPRQRIQIEKKDEIRKRTGGKSPDSADALCLAFHVETWEAEDWSGYVTAARLPS